MTDRINDNNRFVGVPVSGWFRVVAITVGCVMFASGLIGNSLLLVVLWRSKVKDMPKVFFANLGLADLIVICCLPFLLLDLALGWHPVVSERHCSVRAFVLALAYSVSITSLTVVSCNRYVKVCCPLLFRRVFSKTSRNLAICGGLWVFGVLYNLPGLFSSEGTYGYDHSAHTCTPRGNSLAVNYGTVAMIAIILVPLVSVSYFNVAIYRRWRGSQEKVKKKPSSAGGKQPNANKNASRNTGRGLENDDGGDKVVETVSGRLGKLDRMAGSSGPAMEKKKKENEGQNIMSEAEPEASRTSSKCVESTAEKTGVEKHLETHSGGRAANVHGKSDGGMTHGSVPLTHRSNSVPVITKVGDSKSETEVTQLRRIASTSILPVVLSTASCSCDVTQEFQPDKQGSTKSTKRVNRSPFRSEVEPFFAENKDAETRSSFHVGDEYTWGTAHARTNEIRSAANSSTENTTHITTFDATDTGNIIGMQEVEISLATIRGTATASLRSSLGAAEATSQSTTNTQEFSIASTSSSDSMVNRAAETHRSSTDKTAAVTVAEVKKKNKSDAAIVRSLLVISVVLLVLYTPFVIILFISIALHDNLPGELTVTAALLLYANCAVNWIIYGVMNTVFRDAYLSTLKSVLCCCVTR